MITAEEFKEGRILLIDKPLEWSSFQAVNKIKWAIIKNYKQKKIKIGHAGTLDPLASGLLVICTGKFTKKITEIQDAPKTYTGTITVGASTPSYDMETALDAHYPTDHITPELIEQIRQQFLGELIQTPPVFSAIKKEGKRLYEFAREGEAIEVPQRTIYIHSFNLDISEFPNLHFEVECSKGTYIRALAHDFGKALGSGAYLSALRRTKIGNYSVDNATSPDDFVTKHIPDIRKQSPIILTTIAQKPVKKKSSLATEWKYFAQMFSRTDKAIALTLLVLFGTFIAITAMQLPNKSNEIYIEMALDPSDLPYTPTDLTEVSDNNQKGEATHPSTPLTTNAYNQADLHLQHSAEIKTLDELMAEREAKEMAAAQETLLNSPNSTSNLVINNIPLPQSQTLPLVSNKVNKHTLVKYALEGRSGNIPNPVFTCEHEGQIVVNIVVNEAGNVTKATINKENTTTTDDCLIENSLQYAQRAKFSILMGKKEQIGTITYIFKSKR